MRRPAELDALANENFVASFRTLAEHSAGGIHRTFGGVFAFSTGLPVPLFNGCVVVEPVADADLAAALDWVVALDLPCLVFVDGELEAEVAGLLASRDFGRDDVGYPAMVLHPVPDPPAPAAGVEVVRVDEEAPGAFRDVSLALGREPELTERMFPDSLLADPRVQGFVGLLDGRPVGYALAIASEHASGVYNVGTLPEARRRGVGSALTWGAVEAGRSGGFDHAVLQSTPMALGLYGAMGFRKVLDYAIFRPTPSGQATPEPPSRQ